MKKKNKIIISVSAAGAVAIAGISIFLGFYLTKQNENEAIYQKANEHLYKYEFEESEELFQSIINYKDSSGKIGVIHGIQTLNDTGNYDKAIDATVAYGGVIEVNFESEGTPVDPITITTKTKIDAKSYMEHYDFFKWNIHSYYIIENSHSFQLNLFSSFTPHLYTIEYDVGDGFVIDPVRSYKYGTSVTATNAYCDGYTFVGYSVGDDEKVYNPFVIKETDGQDFLLKAHYTPNQYTYQFDANGGSCVTKEGTYTYGQTYLIPSATKDGYIFEGWYTEYGKKLDSTINIDENTTLYAKYTPKQYHINYDLRGGTFLESSPTEYNVESETFTIPYPNRSGYLFAGWIKEGQTDKNSEINYVLPGTSKGDLTLHACWRKYTSDYGNSYIKSLDEFDIPDVYPYDAEELIPGYVIPYNITSFDGNIFNDEKIHSFGVEKINSTFGVIGDENQYLVSKDESAIYKMAFDNEENLDITLPGSIMDVKEYAFAHAPLHSITSENVVNVEKGAFNSSTLENFEFPNAINYGDEAFAECHNLLSLSDSLLNTAHIGDKCFNNTHLTSVTVGDKVNYLGPQSFGGSENYHYLNSFECQSTQYKSLKDVFKGQTGTISITLAKATDSVKDMFGSTDVHLDTLTLVGEKDIPDEFLYEIPTFNAFVTTEDIVTIGDRAFSGTDKSLIPGLTKVTDIGISAFENCENLGEIVLEDIKNIGENAFRNSGLTKINIPETIEYIGDKVFEGCEQLEKIIFESPLQLAKIGNINRLFGEETYAANLDIEVRGSGTLPEKVFQNLYVGKSVTLGENVSLSKFAFNNATSIQYVNFSHTCNTLIPDGCFENVSCLKTIDLTNVVEIGHFAFNNCSSLTSFTCEDLEDNTLGDSLHTINNQAFGNLMKIDHISITNNAITYGTAVFANNMFEIWAYNGATLSSEALKDYLGTVYNL